MPAVKPAGNPSIVNSHLPLADLTAVCFLTFTAVSIGLKTTVPVTTGVPIFLNTSIFTSTGSLVSVAATEIRFILVGSFIGIKSTTSGCHLPWIKERKLSAEPLKTFRSRRALGTPYLLPIPHDEYCQICH